MKEFNKLVRDNMENVYNAIVKSGGQLVTITQMLPDLKGLDVNVIRTCLYRLKAKGLITYENGMPWISVTEKPFHQEKKTERLFIRVTKSQKETIEKKAKEGGLSVSDLLLKPFS